MPASLQLIQTAEPQPQAPGKPFRFPRAQLIEISGDATCSRTTLAVRALRNAQSEGDPVAWVQYADGPLYPPDLAANGIDLESLAVIQIPTGEGAYALLKAAEVLLRSGAFGSVVVDLGQATLGQNIAWQGRLLALAREHHTAVLLLTHKPSSTGSLGPLISLRVAPKRYRETEGFQIEPFFIKNKLGFTHFPALPVHTPAGLR